MPANIPRIAVYLASEDVKNKLEELARRQRRSISQMAALLIEEGLEKAEAEGKLSDKRGDP